MAKSALLQSFLSLAFRTESIRSMRLACTSHLLRCLLPTTRQPFRFRSPCSLLPEQLSESLRTVQALRTVVKTSRIPSHTEYPEPDLSHVGVAFWPLAKPWAENVENPTKGPVPRRAARLRSLHKLGCSRA